MCAGGGMMAQRVVVAMSGGVDSSVAAALLVEQGYDVVGITMRLWTEARPEAFSGKTLCCGIEDIDDARRVAQVLDIPHYVVNLEQPFKRFVVDRFVADYANGLTPNPCLNCNTHIKFDLFLERALALQADYIATGHYARRVEAADGVQLHAAADPQKDQSYVLYTLIQDALDRCLFPVGELVKLDVRAIAARHDLAVAEKPDSADICFVPGGDYREFVGRSVADRPGAIVDRDGVLLGEHLGVQHFTVGQRRGLGVATGEPAFVTSLDATTNVVRLGREEDLACASFRTGETRWFVALPSEGLDVHVRVRYQGAELPGRVTATSPDEAEVTLDQPARAVAPGQAAVFYVGQRVVGGGTIQPAGDA